MQAEWIPNQKADQFRENTVRTVDRVGVGGVIALLVSGDRRVTYSHTGGK
jgi:hypothetical protein